MWDVSKVTNMNSMFDTAPKFNGDLSKWNVCKATKMSNMFFGASSFNGDLSKWNVSEGTTIGGMFWGAPCSLCDHHVPHSLESPCWTDCEASACQEVWYKNSCSDHVHCTWCESTETSHKFCFSKAKAGNIPQSGWVCEGNDAATGVLARKLPLVMI